MPTPTVASLPRHGIRRFLIFWVGAILLSFIVLCGGLLFAMSRMRARTASVVSSTRSLEINHRFELLVLRESRQNLLWRTTGNKVFLEESLAFLRTADGLATQLRADARTAEERSLTQNVLDDFQNFRTEALAEAARERPVIGPHPALEQLFSSIQRHRTFNENRVETMLASSQRLDRMISLWTAGLILTSTIMLLVGGLRLWLFIFKPAIGLARAVKQFGGGDLQARAPIVRDDEMGALSRTFNAMADAIDEREKERQRFVATVAHDLKNPLVVIGGAAHLLERKALNEEQQAEWLRNIGLQTHKMEAMIADLTDSVQAQSGRLALNRQSMDLTELVRTVSQTQAETINSHTIVMECDKGCLIHGDHKRLESVVMNLVSNAVKYSPPESRVQVRVRSRRRHGIIIVRDAGAGIPAEDLDKLFLPFSRLDHTRDMASGTGLGLSSVKKIVEAHGGTVQLWSRLGKGTLVKVCLPRFAAD